MQTFEITLEGYNSETSDTDYLILWINAKNMMTVTNYILNHLRENVIEIRNIGERNLSFDDGVDIILY